MNKALLLPYNINEDGEAIEAVTYIKSGQLEETSPSKEYLALIQQGYRDWGIAQV